MKLCRTNNAVSDWEPDYTDEGALQRRLANSSSSIHTRSQLLVTPALRHNDLGKEVAIMLAWSPNLDGLYEDFFLIVWRVSKFGKSGPYWATETHTAQLAACLLQSPGREWEGHQRRDLHQYQSPTRAIMQNSKKTTLTKANNVYHFSPLPRQCHIVRLPEV
ncbi:uncharacterized protein F5147DRAFT_655953 [Suillus discolor]|uniref:Uncharacterized protein n=1 Tax=Suillus discolor TaxID=1912936 RepID=A0A9P7EZM3_9AGAM|nr:uncharacterized protein F5147DRAFT_655953 [Suillus discolor]KAG2098979.1 hypothetical protein F5147DRAFT_655953 [Suillus discolor]